MLKVYKYEIGFAKMLKLPVGAKVLSVGFQGDDLMLWALVNPEEPNRETRKFMTYGTGHEVEHATLQFIGTSHTRGLVFHTFEEQP